MGGMPSALYLVLRAVLIPREASSTSHSSLEGQQRSFTSGVQVSRAGENSSIPSASPPPPRQGSHILTNMACPQSSRRSFNCRHRQGSNSCCPRRPGILFILSTPPGVPNVVCQYCGGERPP